MTVFSHFCDAASLLAPVMMSFWSWDLCHSIADTLRKVLCKFELNQTDSFRDTAIFCVIPLFSDLTIIWPSRIWNMASEPMPQQMITQSAQATADAIASVLTVRTTSISLPIYNWDSKDAYHCFSIFWHTLENWLLLTCITPICFCSPGNQIPGDACTIDAYWQWRGMERDQGKSFCLPWQNTTGNDTQHQHPCAPWRTWGCCGQARRRPSSPCCMQQNTDGQLQDDQWWAPWAWAASLYHPCILPQGKAPWQTYGKTIQDTF